MAAVAHGRCSAEMKSTNPQGSWWFHMSTGALEQTPHRQAEALVPHSLWKLSSMPHMHLKKSSYVHCCMLKWMLFDKKSPLQTSEAWPQFLTGKRNLQNTKHPGSADRYQSIIWRFSNVSFVFWLCSEPKEFLIRSGIVPLCFISSGELSAC